ncbi:MAG: hypothetical protein ABRQ37_28035, partial [Candidatus Eremiobacterota bacterium]
KPVVAEKIEEKPAPPVVEVKPVVAEKIEEKPAPPVVEVKPVVAEKIEEKPAPPVVEVKPVVVAEKIEEKPLVIETLPVLRPEAIYEEAIDLLMIKNTDSQSWQRIASATLFFLLIYILLNIFLMNIPY